MKFALALCLTGLAGLLGLPEIAHAQQLATVRVASGLDLPVFASSPAGDDARLFIAGQRGAIRLLNIPANTLNGTPYLTIPGVAYGSEQGLLGMAFHPQFLQNGFFYVNYDTVVNGHVATTIARLRATPPYATSTTADPASLHVLWQFPTVGSVHQAGWLAFGPDGYLYCALGDNANGSFTAQDLTKPQGKMLRIDVDGPDDIPGNDDDVDPTTGAQYRIPPSNPFQTQGMAREIFAYGLRNPWRNSFDRATGDLWIGDVGQTQRDEIDFSPFGSGAGWNYGWACREGSLTYGDVCRPTGGELVYPILEYAHGANLPPLNFPGCAVTGGYVYRGSAIPCLYGKYIFADYCTGTVCSVKRRPDGTIVNVVNHSIDLTPPGETRLFYLSSFGEDNQGELYVINIAVGNIYKIIPRPGDQGPDCNQNGIPDACEIANGDVPDDNHNGIPDSCECDTDFNHDGVSDQGDVDRAIQSIFDEVPADFPTDFNHDGVADQGDIDAIINAIAGGGCP